MHEHCPGSFSSTFCGSFGFIHWGFGFAFCQHMRSAAFLYSIRGSPFYLHSIKSSEAPPSTQISDFGLSAKMGLDETHIEGAHHGTLSHMAPEVLREGRQSKASDV